MCLGAPHAKHKAPRIKREAPHARRAAPHGRDTKARDLTQRENLKAQCEFGIPLRTYNLSACVKHRNYRHHDGIPL